MSFGDGQGPWVPKTGLPSNNGGPPAAGDRRDEQRRCRATYRRGSTAAAKADERGELTLRRIGVKGAADTELTMRSRMPAQLNIGDCPDWVGGADARLRLTKTTAKTTTKTV